MPLHRSKRPRTVPRVRWRWGLNVLHLSRQYRREGVGVGVESRYKLLYCTIFFFLSFSVVSSAECTNQPFQTKPESLCNGESFFQIQCKEFQPARPCWGGVRKSFFFSLPSPEPVVGGPSSLIQNKNPKQYITSVL